MQIDMQIILLLIANYSIMILIYLKSKTDIPKVVGYSLALIPIFGPLCFVLLKHTHAKQTNMVTPDKVTDKSHSFGFQQMEQDNEIIAIEEAMLLNSPQEQRRLVKKILREENLEDYLSVLQSDLLYSDVEVTHYATVALVEIQNNYEKTLQVLRQQHHDDPNDQKILIELTGQLSNYIESGLPDGNLLTIYREEYSAYLTKICSKETISIDFFEKIIRNYLEMQNFKQANKWLLKMEERFPKIESVQVLKFEYFVQVHNSQEMNNTLELIENQNKPISKNAQNKLELWQ